MRYWMAPGKLVSHLDRFFVSTESVVGCLRLRLVAFCLSSPYPRRGNMQFSNREGKLQLFADVAHIL